MDEINTIIVSYNTNDFTIGCIDSIFKQKISASNQVMVLDNASTDGSAETIYERFPDIHLIASKMNYGFAKGNNIVAEKLNAEYLLLLNPDTVILDNAIQKIYDFAIENPKNLIYGGRTLFGDGNLNPSSCWSKATPWSFFCYGTGLTSLFRKSILFNPEAYGGWQRDTVREVDIVSGCFFLIKKSLWDELGGFDPRFFMYGEEADLCLRAKKLGARPIICPDATIIHYGGASEKVRADKMVKLFKAKIELIKRHWSPGWVPFGVFMYKWAALSRFLVCSFLAIFQKRFKDSAQSWCEIWQRRKEWEAGCL